MTKSARIGSHASKRAPLALLTVLVLLVLAFTALIDVAPASAQVPIPSIGLEVGEADSPQEISSALQVLVILTLLTLAPAFLLMMTSFTRIIIVLGFIRNAMGTPNMPPNQILIGIALFLTFFVMSPTLNEVNEVALQPYLAEEITQEEALDLGQAPLRDFMMKQTREKDIALFVDLGEMERPQTADDVEMSALIPAFILSELKTAFTIGFLIFIPFLLIDMVVASILMSMGMMMLPPVMISLPFKILLFVLVDGWYLITKALIQSFG